MREYPILSGTSPESLPLVSTPTECGEMSVAGGDGVGVDFESSRRQMIESAGRDESDFANHKYSGSLPVEENRETMAG